MAHRDLNFAEQLYRHALEIERDPIHRHYILAGLADFYKNHVSDPIRWFKVIQDDFSLLPAFVEAWRKREGSFLPGYSALDEMIRILRNRGDLPEALSLCKRAREMGLAGDWDTQIQDLQRRMEEG